MRRWHYEKKTVTKYRSVHIKDSCPCCSSKAIVVHTNYQRLPLPWVKNRERDVYHIECTHCGLRTCYYDSRQAALIAWPKRHVKTQGAQEPVLSKHNNVVFKERENGIQESEELPTRNWHCPICGGVVGEQFVRTRSGKETIIHNQKMQQYCSNCGTEIKQPKLTTCFDDCVLKVPSKQVIDATVERIFDTTELSPYRGLPEKPFNNKEELC